MGEHGDRSLAHCGGLAIMVNRLQVEKEARYEPVRCLREDQRERVDNKCGAVSPPLPSQCYQQGMCEYNATCCRNGSDYGI